MKYKEAIRYLNSFIDYEKLSDYKYKRSFKLERMKKFLATIDNPQENLKVIHVAGSKGKGSVCAFIAYILKEANFKVGLYTSPHLNDFRERIRILKKGKTVGNGAIEFEGMISKQDIYRLIDRLKKPIDKFNKKSKLGSLSFFEVYTALSFAYFNEQKVDFVVLEAGLGGRLDATNVCSSIISIITPISLEHTKWLGRSIRKIAFEKASIIKQDNQKSNIDKVIAISAKQKNKASRIIKIVANKNKAFLLQGGKDFKFFTKNNDLFDYNGLFCQIRDLWVNLFGSHQIENASLAIATIEALRYYNVNIDKRIIRLGLQRCQWPARYEVVAKRPLIIIDGAQNSASQQALKHAIRKQLGKRKVWVIFGMAKDKEISSTCKVVSQISKSIILTKADNPRAMNPSRLQGYFRKSKVLLSKCVEEALNLALSRVSKEDAILATGSLYICGEARSIIQKRK